MDARSFDKLRTSRDKMTLLQKSVIFHNDIIRASKKISVVKLVIRSCNVTKSGKFENSNISEFSTNNGLKCQILIQLGHLKKHRNSSRTFLFIFTLFSRLYIQQKKFFGFPTYKSSHRPERTKIIIL